MYIVINRIRTLACSHAEYDVYITARNSRVVYIVVIFLFLSDFSLLILKAFRLFYLLSLDSLQAPLSLRLQTLISQLRTKPSGSFIAQALHCSAFRLISCTAFRLRCCKRIQLFSCSNTVRNRRPPPDGSEVSFFKAIQSIRK